MEQKTVWINGKEVPLVKHKNYFPDQNTPYFRDHLYRASSAELDKQFTILIEFWEKYRNPDFTTCLPAFLHLCQQAFPSYDSWNSETLPEILTIFRSIYSFDWVCCINEYRWSAEDNDLFIAAIRKKIADSPNTYRSVFDIIEHLWEPDILFLQYTYDQPIDNWLPPNMKKTLIDFLEGYSPQAISSFDREAVWKEQ